MNRFSEKPATPRVLTERPCQPSKWISKTERRLIPQHFPTWYYISAWFFAWFLVLFVFLSLCGWSFSVVFSFAEVEAVAESCEGQRTLESLKDQRFGCTCWAVLVYVAFVLRQHFCFYTVWTSNSYSFCLPHCYFESSNRSPLCACYINIRQTCLVATKCYGHAWNSVCMCLVQQVFNW